MEETSQPLRPAKRKEPKLKAEPKIKTVGVSDSAFTQVENSSKKLKMSKSKFASAAIAFFAESGLDPTAERPQGLASVSRKVEAGVETMRTQNNDIGNRLYALVRGFERTMYAFMQQQQLATYSYMESIESNLQHHLVALETKMLEPMLEHLLKTQQEAYITRGVTTRVLLDLMKKPEVWQAQNDKFTEERDEVLTANLREFAKTHKILTPQPVRKPGATPVPTRPVAPTPATPPVAPAPVVAPKA